MGSASQEVPAEPARESQVGLVPVLACVALLIVSLFSYGGFAVRHWAPVAIFALVVLVAMRRRRLTGAPLAAVAALWGLAIWTLLSALWSDSPGAAVEGGARTLLLAALFALAVGSLHERRTAQRVGAAALAGLAALVVVTYLRVLLDGEAAFLAGRLDVPVGYRNGTAALFVLAFWPLLCTAAARHVATVVRAPAFALATTALGLAFLTQSRGALIGFAAGGLVAVAVGPDRLRRAWLAIVAVGMLAIASGALLGPYEAFVAGEPVDGAVIGRAAAGLAVLAVVALAVGALVALLDNGLRLEDRHWASARRLGVAGLVAIAVLAVGGALATVGSPVGFVRDKVDEFRVLNPEATGSSRLGSTGGQRYDLWRIAVDQFASAPVVGVGEGSYRFGYYAARSTDRNLSTPHSLPLSLLAETGLVGAGLFALFLAAIVATFARRWRAASAAGRRWASAAAAAGAVLLGQSAVDWLWEVPGLAGLGVLALGLAVALVSVPERDADAAPPSAPLRLAHAALVVLAALVVTAVFLSDFHVRKARAAGDRSAPAQLRSARTAERLNPTAIAPLLLQAGALEELGRVAAARAKLDEARRLEPRSFVLLALRGDLELRAGNERRARDLYRRALELNPRDVGLRRLAGAGA